MPLLFEQSQTQNRDTEDSQDQVPVVSNDIGRTSKKGNKRKKFIKEEKERLGPTLRYYFCSAVVLCGGEKKRRRRRRKLRAGAEPSRATG